MNFQSIFKNDLNVTPGTFPECYAFSIHKAGSSLMHAMIAQVCRAVNIPAMNIPDAMFLEDIKSEEWENDPELLELIGPGRIYYGFRNLPEIFLSPQILLRDKKTVLLVRDPRDALVSEYYSFGGKHLSHRLPDKNKEAFLDRVKANADLDIDAYVLWTAGNHLKKLMMYQSSLDFSLVLLRHYEEIYFDKRTFLTDIFAHFGVSVPIEVIEKVAAQNDIRPAKEDISKHIRKGTPGDHREKLRYETIAKLNNIFRDICRFYGYDLDA
jgi:hypothetical protein